MEFVNPKLKELLFFFLKKLFYFRRGLSENQKFLINKKFLIFSIFFFLKIKSPVFFFSGEPLRDFHHCFFFSSVFIFHHCFLEFSLLIAFFLVIIFLHLDCFFCWICSSDTPFLCCYTTSATDLRKPSLLSVVFYLILLPHICHDTTSATDLRQIFFTPRRFLLYLPLRHYQPFPGFEPTL